jgi:hypothetical protein
MSFHRTLLNTMKSSAAYKAMTRAEEKVGIITGKSRESVKGETVNGNGDRGGEH